MIATGASTARTRATTTSMTALSGESAWDSMETAVGRTSKLCSPALDKGGCHRGRRANKDGRAAASTYGLNKRDATRSRICALCCPETAPSLFALHSRSWTLNLRRTVSRGSSSGWDSQHGPPVPRAPRSGGRPTTDVMPPLPLAFDGHDHVLWPALAPTLQHQHVGRPDPVLAIRGPTVRQEAAANDAFAAVAGLRDSVSPDDSQLPLKPVITAERPSLDAVPGARARARLGRVLVRRRDAPAAAGVGLVRGERTSGQDRSRPAESQDGPALRAVLDGLLVRIARLVRLRACDAADPPILTHLLSQGFASHVCADVPPGRPGNESV